MSGVFEHADAASPVNETITMKISITSAEKVISFFMNDK
jgi:hypothetical protein